MCFSIIVNSIMEQLQPLVIDVLDQVKEQNGWN